MVSSQASVKISQRLTSSWSLLWQGFFILNALCDSNWAGDVDDRSTTGFTVFLGPCLISWSAKKQEVVSRSSIESENQSMALVIAELYWLRMLLKDLRIPHPCPPTLRCNNLGALSLATNPVFHAVATPGILFRVFLFHFEKISGHFSLFRVFRDVSVNTS